jgi:CRP-like cAMP-binding protein
MDIGRKRHLEDRRNAQRIKNLLSDIDSRHLQNSFNSVTMLRPIRKLDNSIFLSKTPTSFEGDDEDSCNTQYILSAEGYIRLIWDIFVMIALLIQSFYIPFSIAFAVPLQGNMLYLDFILTVGFLIDILLTFNTTFYKRGTLVKNRRVIAMNYIRGWLWVDLIASFPYDWVINRSILIPDDRGHDYKELGEGFHASKLMRMVKIFKLFRMFKLLRLAKLKMIIIKIEDLLYNEFLAHLFVYVRLGTFVFLMAHWTACIWFFASSQSLTSVSESWVIEMQANHESTTNLLENYITSLYWAFCTMITIGYGDIHAHSNNERIAAMISMCLACGFFSFIVGNISSLISSQNARGSNHRETFLSVNKFMRKKSLPHDLQFKVRRYLDYVFEHHKSKDLDEHQILEMLSDPLRDEIYLCTYGKILISYKIFPLLFSSSVIAQLTKLFIPETYAPGDIVIEEGKIDRIIYFIISGTVSIFHKKSNSLLKALGKGAYFGEIGFFANQKRTASVKCMSFTELLTLNCKTILNEFEKNPAAKEALDLIEIKCRDGDFTELDVRCFLCKARGHVALKCHKILFNLDNKNTKQKWLAERNVTARKINPYDDLNPNFHRKPKHVQNQLKHININGHHRSLRQIYPHNKTLVDKIRIYNRSKSTDVSGFLSMTPNSYCITPVSSMYGSPESCSNFPHIEDIYSLSEDEEIEDKEPVMLFDRSLVSFDSILKSCRSEGDLDSYQEDHFHQELSYSDICPNESLSLLGDFSSVNHSQYLLIDYEDKSPFASLHHPGS